MKPEPRHVGSRTAAFTLVELLVVIAIIAILAGILLPAMRGAFSKAEKAQVQAEVQSIKTAIQSFVNDYGKLPVNSADQGKPDIQYDGNNSKVIFKALTANDNALNPRRIPYLETRDAAIDGSFVDVWSNQYSVVLDNNYDGKLKPDNSDVLKKMKLEGVSATTIVISPGPDRKVEETDDNIASSL